MQQYPVVRVGLEVARAAKVGRAQRKAKVAKQQLAVAEVLLQLKASLVDAQQVQLTAHPVRML